MNKSSEKGSLLDRTLYVPRMSIEGASALAAAYRSIGLDARLAPESDVNTNELARRYTIGEECYPQIVTLGSLLKLTEEQDFDPDKTAYLMPTTGGPCRFGQYKQLLEKILTGKGLDNVLIVSPSSSDGYIDFGNKSDYLFRNAWWAVVSSDALRKLLLQTRPYERFTGDTDKIHIQSIDIICSIIERQNIDIKQKLNQLIEAFTQIVKSFAAIPGDYSKSKPLIGVIGEIYCRLDSFANAELIRRIEKYGGEVWLSSVAEWVWYTNFYQEQDLKTKGESFSLKMLSSKIRSKVQLKDEHRLMVPLGKRFEGYEEPTSVNSILELANPYLPHWGAIGEMILNIGGAIYFHHKGADGIIDISPFTCMNGIVSQAIYPRVIVDYDAIPIKNFYFDETESDYDRDVEIFLELAQTYKRRKKRMRIYPSHFSD
jgi:predicted nucleotide-binding protein (sugar kinase/HSP70/actin superfamily)